MTVSELRALLALFSDSDCVVVPDDMSITGYRTPVGVFKIQHDAESFVHRSALADCVVIE